MNVTLLWAGPDRWSLQRGHAADTVRSACGRSGLVPKASVQSSKETTNGMSKFRWGIFGTGAMSYKFAAGLSVEPNAEVAFIASRTFKKAKVLANALSVSRAIEDYARAAAEGCVDAIYIATPPSVHVEQALLSIDAGIPVLVEKPMAMSEIDVRLIADAARARNVFAMEALWTRFLPATRQFRDRVNSQDVGEPRVIAGNFGVSWLPDPANAMFISDLGGGALSHLSSYPLSLSQWMFGEPQVVQAVASIGHTGVDEDVAFQLSYASGVIGSFVVSLRSWAPDSLHIFGSEGTLSVKGSIVRPHGISVSSKSPLRLQAQTSSWTDRVRQNHHVHQIAQHAAQLGLPRARSLRYRYKGNGYHYEAEEVRTCVEQGLVESSTMPLSDSIGVAATVDQIRKTMTTTGRIEKDS